VKIFADAENILRYAERTVLQSGDVHLPATGIDDSQKDALDFLLALNYLEHDETCRGLVPATLNLSTSENRHALLKLASKMNRAFQLPSPHAPGATFFGGTMAAVTFGLAAHGHGSASAGGRGTTFRAAFEGCLGEVAEYISFLQRDNDPLIATGPDHRSADRLHDAWAMGGVGRQENTSPDELDWIEARSLLDQSARLLPAGLVLRSPCPTARKTDSSGLGAGTSKYHAIRSALQEAIERDAAALWWYGRMVPGLIDEPVQRKTGFSDFAKKLRGDTEREFWLLDITSDLNIPVVAALSALPDGSAVVAGFSAGTEILDAMHNAFLEMCQMEIAQDLAFLKLQQAGPQALHEQDHIWIRRSKTLTLSDYPQLKQHKPFVKHKFCGERDPLEFLITSIARKGYEPLFVDLTRSEIGIAVVRVIVPGFQSHDPSWISDRLLEHVSQDELISMTSGEFVSPI
tara:strand:+ start:11472 stop:12851 length:1380 start_codon:yes stop_codon:yes gene_type:complete